MRDGRERASACAVFVARICNDLQCTGGDDVIVQDNAAGDSIAMTGAISFSTSAFGYTFVVNTSQSKPMIGSATAPQLDLIVRGDVERRRAGNVFLYASDTDFLTGGQFTLTLGGTNSGGSGSVQGRAWGGTSNTEFQFSGANLLSSLGPLTTGPTFAAQRDERVRAGRQPVLADDRHDSHAHDGRNEHRQPEPAGLGDSGTEHLGDDPDGGGTRRLRRTPAPPALGSSRTAKPASAGFVVSARRRGLSRAWFGARTSAAGDSR